MRDAPVLPPLGTPCQFQCVSTKTIFATWIYGLRDRSPEKKIGFFSMIFRRVVSSPWFGFLAHGFLIMDLELGFWSLVKTLYCIINILYNGMK